MDFTGDVSLTEKNEMIISKTWSQFSIHGIVSITNNI